MLSLILFNSDHIARVAYISRDIRMSQFWKYSSTRYNTSKAHNVFTECKTIIRGLDAFHGIVTEAENEKTCP